MMCVGSVVYAPWLSDRHRAGKRGLQHLSLTRRRTALIVCDAPTASPARRGHPRHSHLPAPTPRPGCPSPQRRPPRCHSDASHPRGSRMPSCADTRGPGAPPRSAGCFHPGQVSRKTSFRLPGAGRGGRELLAGSAGSRGDITTWWPGPLPGSPTPKPASHRASG